MPAPKTPITGKVVKKPKKLASRKTYVTKFKVQGPVIVKTSFAVYSIGAGDTTTFSTSKGKNIVVSRHTNAAGEIVLTVEQPTNVMKQPFVADTIGPNSSMVMDFGGGFSCMSF